MKKLFILSIVLFSLIGCNKENDVSPNVPNLTPTNPVVEDPIIEDPIVEEPTADPIVEDDKIYMLGSKVIIGEGVNAVALYNGIGFNEDMTLEIINATYVVAKTGNGSQSHYMAYRLNGGEIIKVTDEVVETTGKFTYSNIATIDVKKDDEIEILLVGNGGLVVFVGNEISLIAQKK